jgi:hypothetical protein
MGAQKMHRMASALMLLERYHKDGNEFLNHIITGDEIWVSFVNVETKELSKQWIHRNSPNKQKKFKQMLSACQKAGGSCFLRQERSADGWIHAKRDHNVRSVSHVKDLNNCVGLFRTKGVECWHTVLVLLHDNVCPHTGARTPRAFLLGTVRPPSLQPRSCSKWLPPVYLPEELVVITVLQQ